jgi:hypothetical protein
MMELEDCAFPLLAGMEAHNDPNKAFKDTDYALLVGARPRGPGMVPMRPSSPRRARHWTHRLRAMSKFLWWAIPPTPMRTSR